MNALKTGDLKYSKNFFLAWDQSKEIRYKKNSLPLQSLSETRCDQLDDLYGRIEGLADFAAFDSLLRIGGITFDQVVDYYELAILDDPSNPVAIEFQSYGFYVEGAIYGFYLASLDPSGSWKKIIAENRMSLRELAKRLSTKP